MEDVHPFVKIGLALVAIVAVIALIVFAVTYRKEETIVIEGRWWTSTTWVKYDVTRLVTECTPETTCVGFGDDRKCTTSTDCHLVSKTTTYTRCASDMSGDVLPVAYPDAPCAMQPGDYIRYASIFYVSYHRQEEAETKRSPFSDGLWDLLGPRCVVRVEKNILGVIVEAEVKQRPI